MRCGQLFSVVGLVSRVCDASVAPWNDGNNIEREREEEEERDGQVI